MMRRGLAVAAFAALVPAALAAQVTAGQQDTFEGAASETEGWVVGGAPGVVHPAPPVVVGSGGPGGAGDGYLQLTSLGDGAIAGSRMSAYNVSQWSGDWRAAGIGSLQVDLQNLGTQDLFIRFLWVEFGAEGPVNAAVTSDVAFLAAGSGWQTFTFSLAPGSLVTLFGTAEGALSNASELRLFHNPDPIFFGPPNSSPAIQGQLGMDNLTAVAVVPEPATVLLLGTGLVGVAAVARRRQRAG